MSAFKGIYKAAVTFSDTSQVSKFRWTSPTNQKCWVRFGLHSKATGSSANLLWEVRRGTSGGSLNSAVTMVKVNGMDTETFQGSLQTYASQPTNNGSIVDAGVLAKDDRYQFTKPILVNGAESVDLWLTPGAASVTLDVTTEVEQ